MHGSVVIFCLYEDYEKIEFCVISLDRVSAGLYQSGVGWGWGGGVSFMLFGGDLGEKLPHKALTNMLVLKDQELTYEVLCPRDRIPCTVI